MQLWLTIAFFALIALLLAIDLGITRRRPRNPRPIEAALSAAMWILAAIGFAYALAYAYETRWLGLGSSALLGRPHDSHEVWWQFVTAFGVEIALSIDNLMVVAAVFAFLNVPAPQRHRVLFWTILAVLLARAGLIALGSELLRFNAMRWVLATILVLATLRTLVVPDEGSDLNERWLVKLTRRLTGGEAPGRKPLVVVLLLAAAADASFALDSISAVFGVTRDPLVALTSNTFAVLALRSLYFAVAPFIGRFRFLKISVTLVLLGMAAKLVLQRYDVPATMTTLAGVVGVCGLGVAASILRARSRGAPIAMRPTPLEDLAEAAVVTKRNLKKMIVLIAGTIVVIFGIAIAPLPGPGPIVIVPLGLALLATEFIWAQRLLTTFKRQTAALQDRADQLARNSSPWIVPPAILAFWAGVYVMARFGPFPPRVVWFAGAGLFLPVAYWAYRTIVGPRSLKAASRNGKPSDRGGPADAASANDQRAA